MVTARTDATTNTIKVDAPAKTGAHDIGYKVYHFPPSANTNMVVYAADALITASRSPENIVILEQGMQYTSSLRRQFEKLADQWEQERPHGVDLTGMVMHPAYQQIIGMGQAAIPFLLARLEHSPDHWFWALHSITGADPVSVQSQGQLSEMAKAWIDWGHRNGYRW
jgi:hypothetical protein